MAAPVCVITVIKDFVYRDSLEEWSNTYFLTGAAPGSSDAFRDIFDALVAQEKTMLDHARYSTRVIRGIGYNHVPDAAHPAVWSVDLRIAPDAPVNGTLVAAGGSSALPGDVAAWVRWGLDRFNTKGKRVYLRKYYHGVSGAASDQDKVEANFITAANAFGQKLTDGTFLDGRKLTDRLGTALLGHKTSTFLTTRTLKRRGKRPPP